MFDSLEDSIAMRQTGYDGLFGFWFGQKSRNRGTVCGNSARTDLWGERRVTDASTRTGQSAGILQPM